MRGGRKGAILYRTAGLSLVLHLSLLVFLEFFVLPPERGLSSGLPSERFVHLVADRQERPRPEPVVRFEGAATDNARELASQGERSESPPQNPPESPASAEPAVDDERAENPPESPAPAEPAVEDVHAESQPESPAPAEPAVDEERAESPPESPAGVGSEVSDASGARPNAGASSAAGAGAQPGESAGEGAGSGAVARRIRRGAEMHPRSRREIPYPQEAWAEGWEAICDMALAVDARGHVTRVLEVRCSSHTDAFESEIRRFALRHYRFQPAYADGLAVASVVRWRHEFVID